MYPMLKPALRRGWRDTRTVRFGVAPAHSVVLGPLDTATGTFLGLVDGTRSMPQLEAAATSLGLSPGHARSVVVRLGEAGLLDSPKGGGPAADAVREDTAAYDRLRPDLASLSLQHPEPAGSLARMGARRTARVRVRGAGRVGAAVAALLSASGVGRVDVLDGGRVEPWDTLPAGVAADQVGRRRDAAARRLVGHSSPWTTRGHPRPAAPAGADRTEGCPTTAPEAGSSPAATSASCGTPALTVVAPRDGLAAYAPDPLLLEPLMEAGAPHLFVGVMEGTGLVGPLVVPGRSACSRCWELGRTDIEPAWPRLLAQWRSGRAVQGVAATDAALATLVAGLASVQALAFLDGLDPPCLGARWETALPCGDWRLRRVTPHPECGCGVGADSVAAGAAVAAGVGGAS
ncbi:ThiF family adenylyltransferase [Streptomyces sp. NPDC059740]|uniref:ThiF family adenylyltransferase n=1 Tax=Streptomyces sp. NPDC059740 TaxID=3346926 RepID=UPI0036690301